MHMNAKKYAVRHISNVEVTELLANVEAGCAKIGDALASSFLAHYGQVEGGDHVHVTTRIHDLTNSLNTITLENMYLHGDETEEMLSRCVAARIMLALNECEVSENAPLSVMLCFCECCLEMLDMPESTQKEDRN